MSDFGFEANLIAAADAGFESALTGNWSATNATLALDSTHRFVGTQSLKVTCTTTGTVTVTLATHLPVAVPKGLAWGCHAYSPSAVSVTMAVNTLSSTGFTTNLGSDVQLLAASWLPLSGKTNTGPLSGHVTDHGVVTFTAAMTVGQVFNVDLVAVFATVGQVLVDWLGFSFGVNATAGQNFADLTGATRFDVGVSMTDGRQDGIDDVQTGQCTFSLQNDKGWFTPLKTTSPWFGQITLGRRVQVNATDNLGTWHTRFDGSIAGLAYTVDATGNTNVCNVTCSDVLAYLNKQEELQCWTKETVLSDNPILHWTLDDGGQTGQAIEGSGNNGPSLTVTPHGRTGVTGLLEWASGDGGVEIMADSIVYGSALELAGWSSPLQSPHWTPSIIAGSVGANQYWNTIGPALGGPIPALGTNTTGQDYSFEAWFMVDPTVVGSSNFDGPYTVFSLANTRDGQTVTVSVNQNSFTVQGNYFTQPPIFNGSAASPPVPLRHVVTATPLTDTTSLPHHLVITITGNSSGAAVWQMWVDGVATTTSTIPVGFVINHIDIGSAYGGGGGFFGNISLMSIYNYKLSSTQIANHVSVGQVGRAGIRTDAAVQQLAAISGVPSYWSNLTTTTNGLSVADYLDISGGNALSGMQTYEQVERGLLFTDAKGKLQFHTRDWRMGYGASDLTLPNGTYEPDLNYIVTDQGMANIASFGSQLFSVGKAVNNQASRNLYGDYADGSATSPTQIALPSWSPVFAANGLPAYFTDPYMDDAGAWAVNTYGQPALLCGSLTVNLMALNSLSGLSIAQLYALEIDNMVTLGGPPASFPDAPGALDYFIEGKSELLSQGARTLTFYTSPANQFRAWKPGDATYGVLGSTAKVGISAVDTHTVPSLGKRAAADAGAPYWPPTISSTMNNPAANSHSFLGMNDLRGIVNVLKDALNPPLLIVGQTIASQSYASASASFGEIAWDTIYTDTVAGMGAVSNWPNWYCVMQAGYYDIEASVMWDGISSLGTRVAQLAIAQKAAYGVVSGALASPYFATECDFITGQVPCNAVSLQNVSQLETRVYLGVGDMVTLALYQDSGATESTSINPGGGSIMSLRFVGLSTSNDQFGNVAP